MARPDKYANGYPSVTEITGFAVSFDGKFWYKSLRKKLLEQKVDLNKVDPIDVADEIRDESTKVGHRVHKAIEGFLRGKPFSECAENLENNNERVMFSSLVDWCRKTKIKPIALEEVLYNKKLEYAGTADVICTFNGGKSLSVVDWKTASYKSAKKGKFIKEKLQATGYILAYNETFKTNMKKAVFVWCTKELEFFTESFTITKEDKKAFLNARELYRYVKGK